MSDISFSKLTWENLPARTTALSAQNLNRIENGINDSVNGVNSNSHSIAELQTRISQIANGSPTPVATVAEMTDESAVYLYTGSETGYTAGNWYYYDGTAWTAGGTYGGAVTDSTLTDPALPANSKAAGDALALKADADDVEAIDDRVTALESGSSGGLTADIKSALLACFANVAWAGNDGQDYYDALDAALNPPAGLVRISAVYTQSGTVYDTASLDDLKTDLVVTVHYDNATTQVITNYTLSGTLTEGTSTITVAYGGKTTTFNVVVSVFNTAPVITSYDKTLTTTGEEYILSGSCLTKGYEFELDVDAFKNTQYYDSENNWCTTSGALYKLTFCAPNSNNIAFSSRGKTCLYNSSDTLLSYYSMARDTSEHVILDTRYNSGYFNLPDNIAKVRFNLTTADLSNSYAYWTAPLSGIMPIGVTAGDIIFAGSNTPYYGCHNISEAVVGT